MTMPKNYLKQNELFSSYVALRICFLTYLVYKSARTILLHVVLLAPPLHPPPPPAGVESHQLPT
jgi:hypothetical protein